VRLVRSTQSGCQQVRRRRVEGRNETEGADAVYNALHYVAADKELYSVDALSPVNEADTAGCSSTAPDVVRVLFLLPENVVLLQSSHDLLTFWTFKLLLLTHDVQGVHQHAKICCGICIL
jgi:hypothetical protein